MFRKKNEVQLDPETLKELEMAFKLYDDQSTSFISGSDLKSIIRAYGIQVNKSNVRELMARINLEYEDKIQMKDFLLIMAEVLPKRYSKQHYERIFRMFDQQGKGKIMPQDIVEIGQGVGEYISEQKLNLLYERGDLDHDGCLNFNEFMTIIKQSDQ